MSASSANSDTITINSRGNYAEIAILRGDDVWRLLVDEKNLAKFILTAQQVLQELRADPDDWEE